MWTTDKSAWHKDVRINYREDIKAEAKLVKEIIVTTSEKQNRNVKQQTETRLTELFKN